MKTYRRLFSINLKKKDGFTLTEVFIAIAIVLMLSSAILTTIIASNRIVSRLNHRVSAINYARHTLEELKNEARDVDGTEGFEQAALNDTAGWVNLALPSGELSDLSGQRRYRIDDATWGTYAVDYKVLSVEVSWTDPYSGETKSVELKTYIADKVSVI